MTVNLVHLSEYSEFHKILVSSAKSRKTSYLQKQVSSSSFKG